MTFQVRTFQNKDPQDRRPRPPLQGGSPEERWRPAAQGQEGQEGPFLGEVGRGHGPRASAPTSGRDEIAGSEICGCTMTS